MIPGAGPVPAGVSAPGGRLDGVTSSEQQPYRSGFAALVGRPDRKSVV